MLFRQIKVGRLFENAIGCGRVLLCEKLDSTTAKVVECSGYKDKSKVVGQVKRYGPYSVVSQRKDG